MDITIHRTVRVHAVHAESGLFAGVGLAFETASDKPCVPITLYCDDADYARALAEAINAVPVPAQDPEVEPAR